MYTDQEGKKAIKPGWSSKINLLIWNQLHLPCCLSFRRIKYRSEDIRTTDGYCRQCSISISTILPNHSNNLSVLIENYTPNFYHDDKLKRKVLPTERKALVEKLKQKTAYALQSELADEAMREGDCVPPHLPSANALRILNCRSQCPEIKQNAVIALYELQKIYVGCIQRLDFIPFAAFYSTPSQRAWYKNEYHYKRSIISIDATGLGLESPTDFNKCIYLYSICAQGEYFV